MWLEVDVSQMKDRRQEPVDTSLLLWGETQDVHGTQQTPEVLPIILPLYGAVPSLHTHTQLSKTTLLTVEDDSFKDNKYVEPRRHYVLILFHNTVT